MSYNQYNLPLLEAVCRRGVLCATSVRYWRGCKRLNAEDLGLDPANVSERLIQLGHKRLVPREALAPFSLIESRAHSLVESCTFPFLGGIARFVPNPRLEALNDGLDRLKEEFRLSVLDFAAGYGPLRDQALAEWREAARQLNGSSESLLVTIEQAFPPHGDIARRFGFESKFFQVAAPESLRLEVSESIDQMEIADQRRRIAEDAHRRLQSDLDGFIRESVTTLREETARLAADVLATIDGSEGGVHQRTLNRLTTFIDSFRSLNFAEDAQLETTLGRFREQLLTRSAKDYRNDRTAMQSLREGLDRLHANAVAMVRTEGREVLARFGQLGNRKLAVAS